MPALKFCPRNRQHGEAVLAGITSVEEGPADTPSSEYEPKELKELLREMGVQQQALQPQNRIKFKVGAYNLLVVVACGATLTAAELRAKATSFLDIMRYNTWLGKALYILSCFFLVCLWL